MLWYLEHMWELCFTKLGRSTENFVVHINVALHQESGFRIRIDLMCISIRIRTQYFFYLGIPIRIRSRPLKLLGNFLK